MRPGKCLGWIVRIKAIEREHQVACMARDLLRSDLKNDPSMLKDRGLERSHFDDFCDNLDATYLIRLFAEFETGLKDYWKMLPGKRPRTRASDLIQSISSKRRVDLQDIENVERVRKYRNKLVHEEAAEAEVVEVREARKFLCIFFSRLPEDW